MISNSLWSKSYGKGDPLLLLHGMGSASSAWNPILDELSKKFKVITIDLPGHGNTHLSPETAMDPTSLAIEVFKLADSYGLEKINVAGNSLGGWIALEMAAMNPNRVLSVTGVAPAGLWLTPYSSRASLLVGSKSVASALRHIAPTMMRLETFRRIGFSSVSPRWQDFSIELCRDAVIAMGSAPGYYPAWDGILKKRFDKEISNQIPTTIIFGDSDNTLPVKTCQERSLAPTHAKWVILPESGHAPMWDNPVEVSAEIIENAMSRK